MSTTADGTRRLVSCPALDVCAEFGTARRTCRYDPEAVPVGMTMRSPEEAWCAPGIVTLVLMMAGRMGVGSGRR